MPDSKNKRAPVRLVKPENLKTEADRRTFIDDLADALTPAINAERARQGKPPLRED